ncbi:threonine--tRNA ligase [Micromonospora sp. DT53]|uniref:threonine--tRNA ligase n=1 Tax=Micromonospora sp. DT53 TaxID=3393444 RepID=UPI003CF9486D
MRVTIPAGSPGADAVATAALPRGGPEAIVVVRDLNGELHDLDWVPATDTEVDLIPLSSPDGLRVLRHSTAHVLAQAVQDLFPEAKLGIGPPIDNGFYYDFGVAKPFTPEDLERIEARMKEIVRSGQSFRRRVFPSLDVARTELAEEPYKLELIDLKGAVDASEVMEVGEGELSIYDNVDAKSGKVVWSDLCRGPHLPLTRLIGAFKLMRVAGAYWRGQEDRPMLQRVYGTAWAKQKDLDDYLWRLEQAELRDHRRIGRELELFHFDPTAPGMPYWLPKGMRVLNNLLQFWRDEHEARGYQEIATPLINNKKLWVTSGHWDHFRDDMFVIAGGDEHSTMALKPMNCPNAMVVYNLKTRSYRDFPLRFSDSDPLHRDERSGALHGLLRVQKFQQDDAHVFVTPAQIREEYERIFDICDRFYKIFGLTYRLRIGTRPDKFIGERATWDEAEATLLSILHERTGGDFETEEGGGAFYGPKIDILMEDALSRQWQTGTIQLDFQLPRRFGCVYIDEHGERQTPVVIHRVVYGSLERFLGIYIEHTAGNFPLWIAPVHVNVLPISDQFVEYGEKVAGRLREAGARVEVDARNETLGNRVRLAQQEKVPMVAVVGAREQEEQTVSLRLRGGKKIASIRLDEFAERLGADLRDRTPELTLVATDL